MPCWRRKVLESMKNWFVKHREVLAYLVFGVLTTLLNIVLYTLFSGLFGYEAANSWGNVLDTENEISQHLAVLYKPVFH